MRAVDIIARKRDGAELTTEEIGFFVQGCTSGDIPDYQTAAWLMTIYLCGMSSRETRDLTLAMAHSGDVLDLSDVAPVVVDKHSTGGVGDKVSLIVVPTVAACGLPVGKISGRGLGFTGGTLDKLESIPGFRVDLSEAEFKDQLRRIGAVLTGQTKSLAPADAKLYALRDVTATVDSIPLGVSSILSKKIAGGANALVLDVKKGSGALMQTLERARQLAEALVQLSNEVGLKTVALISDMSQPLGWAVGNALEVAEALETLRGRGPEDLREHCTTIVAEMLVLGGKAADPAVGVAQAHDALASGSALRKLRELVAAQGGDVRTIDEPETGPAALPRARLIQTVNAPQSGFLARVQADEVGRAVVELGGGREQKSDQIDHSVGVVVHAKVGDHVPTGAPLFTLHASDEQRLAAARERVLAAHEFTQEPVARPPLFYGRYPE
jgi:pyrimidine-nucleoside phosphorylase